jgi:4-amino-4-deoxy-L-arabinose transferase-like glycosyltransferase
MESSSKPAPAWLSRLLESEVCLFVFVAALWFPLSALFASSQELWVDEVTQLSGLTLNPSQVVAWLAGDHQYRFDVPDDRMPPMSYWVGWLWTKLFGLSEGTLRALSNVMIGVAAGFVASASRRAWGVTAGWVSGIAFVLSPNVIVVGCEIRAYPIVLCLAAITFWLMLRLADVDNTKRTKNWCLLTLCCVGAAYTHFFGLVLTGAVFLGLLFFESVRKHALRAWLGSAAAIVLVASGLFPFVRAALNMSSKGAAPESRQVLTATARLVYRVLGGHPAIGVYSLTVAAVLIGTATALGLALRSRGSGGTRGRALLLAVGSGFVVVACAARLTGGFDPQSTNYNIWMVPPIFIALGAAAQELSGTWRKVGMGATSLILLGNLGGAWVLLDNRSTFAHTASERLVERVRSVPESERPKLVVVHDEQGPWGHSYFPLRYVFGNAVTQYLAAAGPNGQVAFKRLPELSDVDLSSVPASRVLLIGTHERGAAELKQHVKGEPSPMLTNEKLVNALETYSFRPEASEELIAYHAAKIQWMRR